MNEEPSESPQPPRPSLLRPRFTLGSIILAMVVCSVVGSGVYYAGRAVELGIEFDKMLVVLVVVMPPLLLITIKIAHAVLLWINRDADQR